MTSTLETRRQEIFAETTTSQLMAALLDPSTSELALKERVSRAWILEELVRRCGGISPEQESSFRQAATLVLFPELRKS